METEETLWRPGDHFKTYFHVPTVLHDVKVRRLKMCRCCRQTGEEGFLNALVEQSNPTWGASF